MLPASYRPTYLAKEGAETPHLSALNRAFGYSECSAISGQRTESLSLESMHHWTCSSLWLICPRISGWLDGPSRGNPKQLFQVLKNPGPSATSPHSTVAPSPLPFSRRRKQTKSTNNFANLDVQGISAEFRPGFPILNYTISCICLCVMFLHVASLWDLPTYFLNPSVTVCSLKETISDFTFWFWCSTSTKQAKRKGLTSENECNQCFAQMSHQN